MDATRTGFSGGVHRIRGIALALLALSLLAGGGAGYLIRAATATTSAVTVTHKAPAAVSRSAAQDPVGDRWWADAPAVSGVAAQTAVGDRWWEDQPEKGATISVDAWWKDMP